MRTISMTMDEYKEDMEEAQSKGYKEGYEDGSGAATDDAERSHSEQLDRFKAEFFHEIGCEGEWGEKWSVGGPADEVIERLQKFHKLKFYKADLSDIPF